jgi:type III restriction enzyme
MELKEFQKKVISSLNEYLTILSKHRLKYFEYLKKDSDIAKDIDFPKKAWIESINPFYYSHKNGLNEPLPDIYFKVPTGGGKTLLACHSIDSINKIYNSSSTGLILWIVPTSQIYKQTIEHLKDREHPYRQILDMSSGGKTLIIEKGNLFHPQDIKENLVILMLMLQSSNRESKETLKMFQDASGFIDFFPKEDQFKEHEKLINNYPNLDYFGEKDFIFGRQIKTSLGNVLRITKPLIIIDEGHKAFSDKARDTIFNLNPSFILELSATPPKNSNKLVEISGKELNQEEMIKLDIHLINKTSIDWKDTMLCSLAKRKLLEKKAKEYKEITGQYIRPINLIQVERTGKDQKESKFIHAEDVKEFLIKQCNIKKEEIAIKSSEKDDIEGLDLFSPNCQIRYIITKQALQEGWDCSFAYILTILTNPSSQTSITQLVGRILRQPKTRKTKTPELDECYIFTFQKNAAELVNNIKTGLESEGLGDIAGRISHDDEFDDSKKGIVERDLFYRKEFKKFVGRIYLPKFFIQENNGFRDINFEIDILSNIDWKQANITSIKDLSFSNLKQKDQELILNYTNDPKQIIIEKDRIQTNTSLKLDITFITKQIVDIIPNPWIAYEICSKCIDLLKKENDITNIINNLVFIIEELKKILEKEKERLSYEVFNFMLKNKKFCFCLLTDKGGYELPSRIKIKSSSRLVRNDNSDLEKSLFDFIPEENLNDLEKEVALYLDEQEKLLWWYRNISRQNYEIKNYHIQGWKKNKIFPDFIAASKNEENQKDYGDIYVIETKGLHLKNNEDTEYKKNVFDLCNKFGKLKPWGELKKMFPERQFSFQVIYEDEWKNKINKIFNEAK